MGRERKGWAKGFIRKISEKSFGSLAHVGRAIQHVRFFLVDAILLANVFARVEGRLVSLLLRCSGWSLGFASAAGSAALIFSRATHSIANASDVGRLSRSYVHLKIHTHTRQNGHPIDYFPPGLIIRQNGRGEGAWCFTTNNRKGGRIGRFDPV